MESKFKVSDVPLVGRARTFYPVCQNLNINKELAEYILVAMNVAVGTVGKKGWSNEEQTKVLKKILFFLML